MEKSLEAGINEVENENAASLMKTSRKKLTLWTDDAATHDGWHLFVSFVGRIG